jgi:hypothetical protein
MFNGNTHYKWPFSIAMLNYQRLSFAIFSKLADGCVSIFNPRVTVKTTDLSAKIGFDTKVYTESWSTWTVSSLCDEVRCNLSTWATDWVSGIFSLVFCDKLITSLYKSAAIEKQTYWSHVSIMYYQRCRSKTSHYLKKWGIYSSSKRSQHKFVLQRTVICKVSQNISNTLILLSKEFQTYDKKDGHLLHNYVSKIWYEALQILILSSTGEISEHQRNVKLWSDIISVPYGAPTHPFAPVPCCTSPQNPWRTKIHLYFPPKMEEPSRKYPFFVSSNLIFGVSSYHDPQIRGILSIKP